MGAILIKKEKDLAKEVLRAFRFMNLQVSRGYTIKEALHQVKNAYGRRVHFYVATFISKKLNTL